MPWSEKRIKLSDAVRDSTQRQPGTNTISEMYHLEAQLFFDIDRIGDSLNIITRAILDPYRSYYHLPQDSITRAFINIYFDLCEIHRRRMHEELRSSSGEDVALIELYKSFVAKHEDEMQEYLKRVDRGTNMIQLGYYNDVVLTGLGIDNFKCFGIKTE